MTNEALQLNNVQEGEEDFLQKLGAQWAEMEPDERGVAIGFFALMAAAILAPVLYVILARRQNKRN